MYMKLAVHFLIVGIALMIGGVAMGYSQFVFYWGVGFLILSAIIAGAVWGNEEKKNDK